MLLRNRTARIETDPANPAKGYEHLEESWLAVLRWLGANHVDFVLVGPAAEAVRGHAGAYGPVAIVPAPYRRNFERLARALSAAHARLRVDDRGAEDEETVPVKVTADKVACGQRLTLRCGQHDLDIEGGPSGTAGYQELLYEAGRFELAEGVSVEVAAPEDVEHYAHLRRTGAAPEFRVTRQAAVEHE